MKMNSINKANNGEFNFLQYIKIERFSILLSVCVVAVGLLARNEIKELEQVGKWLGLSFVMLGYAAQSVVIYFNGKAQKVLNNQSNGDDK